MKLFVSITLFLLQQVVPSFSLALHTAHPSPMSAVDLMCLTNTVQHQRPEDEASIDALRSSLLIEGNLMESRLQEISKTILPSLLSALDCTGNEIQPPSHHLGTSTSIPFVAHKTPLSHIDYMCVVNQMKVSSSSDEGQTQALIHTFQRERSICASRMAVVDEALCHLDHVKQAVGEDDNDVECLLRSIQTVLQMEKDITTGTSAFVVG